MKKSFLEEERGKYTPILSNTLMNVHALRIAIQESKEDNRQSLQEKFPHSISQPFVQFVAGERESNIFPLRVGIFFSGGPAPGGHNVIAGLFDALHSWHQDSQMIGFLDGAKGLIENNSCDITREKIEQYRNLGGFDMIGSGRTKIETEEQCEKAAHSCRKHRLDGLVVVGGDDSNTNAALLAEFFLQKGLPIRVVGVPKTIDGDLKHRYVECSFGFDTATKIYSEMIGNLTKDALSSKKYFHFVKLMGRSASHVTLECALQTQPNLALIGEEVEARGWTLADIITQIADVIEECSQAGKHYGVILVPEGLLEFIAECKSLIQELNRKLAQGGKAEELSEKNRELFFSLPKEIGQQLLYDRDPHGNVRLSQIETEKLLMALTNEELIRREYKGSFHPLPHFFGYEGRAGMPSNFDATYCYALGFVAFGLIKEGCTGYLAALGNLSESAHHWKARGVPLVALMHKEERKGKVVCVIAKKLVSLEEAPFVFFAAERKKWRLGDMYRNPGPIQFWGNTSDRVTRTLELEKD